MSNFKTGKLSLLNKLSLIWNRVAPSWAEGQITSQLYLHNTQQTKTFKIPKGFEQSTIKTPGGDICTYKTGKGPTVVFVHGWGGGAYQFFSLMRGLKECGFTALAFDHLGHQNSENKPATIQQLISTTNYILQQVKKNQANGLQALVGHDIGCIVITNTKPDLIKSLPLFFISPIFNYKLYFLRKLSQLNLHPDILKKYASQFTANYNKESAKLELAKNLPKYSDVCVIAHDKNDTVSAISESIKFCKKFPITKLLITKEWGHDRIISSESVWQELKSHLNYDDTTINFSKFSH
ncbi:MAG: alpha/beta fold hydrolase [Thiotrichaceae bacterium]|nr:alpha/beta fold hydrolase [Thiotrichaceae bacterium]